MDLITANGAQGSVAGALMSNGMSVNALRTNALLRKDEWIRYDEAVVQAAQERLNVAADLMSAGLTFNISEALGTTVVEWETLNEMTEAEISMDGLTRSQQDTANFDLNSVPLPILHKDFQISIRRLRASRMTGQPLDTTQAMQASRQVSESIENLILNGNPAIKVGNGTIYGLTTEPNRNTVTLSTNWDASSKTGTDILDDVLSMYDSAAAANYFGPFMLYVPTSYWTVLQEDFKAESDKTILQRLRELSFIRDVKPADKLAANNVVMAQWTSDVLDLVVGQEPTPVQWEGQGGMVIYMKVMGIMVPRIKADQNGNSGIVHLS